MANEVGVSRVMNDDGGEQNDTNKKRSRTSGAKRRSPFGKKPKIGGRDTSSDASSQSWGDGFDVGEGESESSLDVNDGASQAGFSLAQLTASVTGHVAQTARVVVDVVTGHKTASAFVALGLALVGGVTASVLAPNDDAAIFWVDDEEDECVNYVEEASDNGGEEVKIPETITGDDGTVYKVGYVASWEGRVGPLRGLGLTGDVLKMANFYDANGGHTDSAGFERIGDTYIVALGQGPFKAAGANALHVGDLCTISFDDGTTIKALVGDEKGRYGVSNPYDPSTWNRVITGTDPQGRADRTCGWGHITGSDVCVLEFWGYGGSVMGALRTSTGGTMTRVTGITDHGMAVEFANFAGYGNSVVGGALTSMNDVKASSASDAMSECKTHGDYDNSTLVAALISYSYSQRRVQPDDEPSTALYQTVCEATLGVGDYCYSYHYHSCDRGVAAAVRWTGADVNFPAGACDAQFAYCHSSPLWEVVCENVTIGGGDDWARDHGLQPGDIGISNGEHTLAYVGHDNIVEGYTRFIKGNDGHTPGTGGDIGEPTADSAYVMASSHSRGAGIQATVDGRPYTFFRYVGDYPDRDKYANVGASVTLNGANVNGTPCDCEEEEESCGEQLAIRGLQLAHSAIDDGVDYNALIAQAGLSGSYHYAGGNIYNTYPPTSSIEGAWGSNEPMDEALRSVGINLAFEDWQRSVCIPNGYPNQNWYACCSPWVSGVLAEMGIDTTLTVVAANQREAALSRPNIYTVIPLDPSRSWEDQCQPGDILNCEMHTAMWVGNELAQQYWPGTTGNVVEAGQMSRRNLGVTRYSGNPGGMFSEEHYGCIIRVKCPNDANTLAASSAELSPTGMLYDGSLSATQNKVIAAAKSVGSPGQGLCAMWVSQVFSRAGMPYYGGNACDMYYDWCKYSDRGQLKPGMIIAVPSHPHTSAGSVYGHVAIYIGGGKVMDNIGHIRTTSLDSWISYYGATRTVKWGWIGGRDLRAKGIS